MANEKQPSVSPFMKYAMPLIRSVYTSGHGQAPPRKTLDSAPHPKPGDEAVENGVRYTYQQVVFDPVTILAAIEQGATFDSIAFAWVAVPVPLANQIMSVQPMTSPVGGIAFYRPRYGAK